MALTIPINLNIENLAELNAQVAKMAGAAGGAGAGAAGRGPGAIGAAFGGSEGAGSATAKGLGQIAKQLPGAGMMGDMVGAFKSGGIIGVGMAGVAGILGFVKQIMESSKVFQGIAGSFFKIFGAMADLFLLPMLPLAMRGMQMLMQKMPMMAEAGQKVADWIGMIFERISNEGFFTVIADVIDKALNDFSAWFVSTAIPAMGKALWDATKNAGKEAVTDPENAGKIAKILGFGMVGLGAAATATGVGAVAGVPLMLGGTALIAGGAGTEMVAGKMKGEQFSPVIKRGDQLGAVGGIEDGIGGIMNSMEVSLARQADKVKNYASEFSQKETGAGGVLSVWDDEVLRGSIPDTWDSIDGMYRKMNDELADEARNAESLKGGLKIPDIDLGKGIDRIQADVEKALKELSTITLSDFVLDPSVANDIENCFTMANQCLNTKFTSLSDLVAGGVEYIQAGVGGNIFDLPAINDLVSQAQGMGGAIGIEATRIANQVALMTQEMADPALEQTVNPKAIAAEIKQLQDTVNARILSTANSIAAATANVNGIVDQWAHMANDYMDPALGYGEQFGVLGAAFGEATGRAAGMYGKIRGFTVKRKKQKKSPLDLAWEGAGLDEGLWEDSTYEQIGDTSGVRVTEESGFNFASDIETLQAYDDQFEEGQAAIAEAAAEVAEAAAAAPAPDWDTGTGRTAEQDAMVEAFYESQPDPEPVVHSTDYGGSDFYDYAEEGMQFGGAGGRGGRRGVRNTSHSVMNISINTKSSVQDILSDLKRIQHMDDASFFNSVS